MAAPLQFFVELVEEDVRQQRRKRAALRRPFRPWRNDPSFEHSGPQVSANQSQDPRVFDLAGHPCHQHVMPNPVEELLQVDVDHPPPPFGHMPAGCLYGLMGTPAGPKPIGTRGESGIEQPNQLLMQRLLNEPVQHRGDTQHAHPAAGLGYFYLPHRLGLVASVQQFLLDARPFLDQVVFQLTHRHPIDAWGSLVADYPLVGRHHVAATDNLFHQPRLRFRPGRSPACRDV